MWNGPGSRPGQVQDDRREGNNLPLAGLYDSHISERQEKESTINYLGYPLWRKTQDGGRMRIVDKTHIFRPPRRGRPRCVNTTAPLQGEVSQRARRFVISNCAVCERRRKQAATSSSVRPTLMSDPVT